MTECNIVRSEDGAPALPLSPVGPWWRLYPPSGRASGSRGAGLDIGANATLILEVELIAIKDTVAGRTRVSASDTDAVPASGLRDIKASFKLDPRLTRGLYMGDRWVSPPTYTGVRQEGKEYAVEAKVHGVDARGRRIFINPEWIPSDPEMVAVSPAEGDAVEIVVKRIGESTLKVAARGFDKELLIKATNKGNAIQVEISQ